MKTQDLIISYLSEGKTQAEISELLKAKDIKPNSLSHIEKLLKAVRKQYGANTMFHLGVILTKKNNNNEKANRNPKEI